MRAFDDEEIGMASLPNRTVQEGSATAGLATSLEEALAKHQQGRFDEARAAYDRILEHAPSDGNALFYLGCLNLDEKRFTDAVGALERAREQNPADRAVLWQLARAYRQLGSKLDVEMVCKELLYTTPDTADACFQYAERFFQLGETELAFSIIKKLLTLDPRPKGLRQRLADLYRNARAAYLADNNLPHAIAVLKQELALSSDDITIGRQLCQCLAEASRNEEALQVLQAIAANPATKLAPLPPELQEFANQPEKDQRAGAWATLPAHDDVETILLAVRLPCNELADYLVRRLANRFPESPAVVRLKAIVQRGLGRDLARRSADLLKSIERSFSNDSWYCYQMGLSQRDIGNIAPARIWLNRAKIQSDSPQPPVLFEIGRTELQLGNHAAAAQTLTEALRLAPDMADAYILLHEALLADGRVTEAVDAFDSALRQDALASLTGVHVHPALMSGTGDFKEAQHQAIDRGIPAVMLNSLGNSGSTYVMLRLCAGLRIPAHSILLGQYSVTDVAIPQAVHNMAKGGAICRQHFCATDQILAEFRRCSITEMILQLRDPRQLVLSNLHYMDMLYADGSYIPKHTRALLPDDYFERPPGDKIDYLIETVIPRDTALIESWIDAEEAWPELMIHYCAYEDMIADPDAFLCDILDFYGLPHHAFDWSAGVDKSDAHFRRGKADEWRDVFSEQQKRRAWELTPKSLCERFSWPE